MRSITELKAEAERQRQEDDLAGKVEIQRLLENMIFGAMYDGKNYVDLTEETFIWWVKNPDIKLLPICLSKSFINIFGTTVGCVDSFRVIESYLRSTLSDEFRIVILVNNILITKAIEQRPFLKWLKFPVEETMSKKDITIRISW